MRKLISGVLLAAVASLTVLSPVAARGPNVVELAIAANKLTHQFDTLLTAATCPGFNGAIVDVLDGPEKVTLFAPTDKAFGKLGLTPDNVCSAVPLDALGDILAYHVLPGRVSSGQLLSKSGTSVTMANGDQAAITGRWWNLKIDDAPITFLRDLPASNGVIHVISAVMTPPAS
ncbi:MAG: fasciclin domain-containing protein [Chloroflexota bacterium]